MLVLRTTSRDQRLRERVAAITGQGRQVAPYLLLLPSALLLLAFFAAPFISLGYYATQQTTLGGPSTFIGLGNFRTLLAEARFHQNIVATLQYLSGVLVISVPVAYFAAVLISSVLRGKSLLRTVFLIPWVLAPVVTALLFKTMMDPTTGPITGLLEWAYGRPVYPMLTAGGPMIVVILHGAWRSFPLMMLLIVAGMAQIHPELYEAARVDGAGAWAQFRHITLPLTRAPLVAAIIIISVFTIQDVEGIYALTQGGPGYATEVAAVRVLKEAFVFFNIGFGSSLGIMLVILTCALLTVYLRLLGRGEEV